MESKSLHLEEYSAKKIVEYSYDEESLANMDFVREICSTVLSLRKSLNIRVRLPLKSVKIYTKYKIGEFYLDVIKDEINTKNIEIEDKNFEEVANQSIKINMKLVGQKYKSGMKDILDAQKIKNWKIENGKLKISEFILDEEDFEICYEAKNESNLNLISTKENKGLLLVDTTTDKDIETEGFVRDLIRKIQTERKNQNFHLDDRISTKITTNYDNLETELSEFIEIIKSETLSIDISFSYENTNKSEKITEANVRIDCKNNKA